MNSDAPPPAPGVRANNPGCLYTLLIVSALASLVGFSLFMQALSAPRSLILQGVLGGGILMTIGVLVILRVWPKVASHGKVMAAEGQIRHEEQQARRFRLGDLRQATAECMVYAERLIDKGTVLKQQGNTLIGRMMEGNTFAVGALTVQADCLCRYESAYQTNEKEAYSLIDTGDVLMDRAWSVPLSEVPDAIEVSDAKSHMAGVKLNQASQVEDVYFMHRGRRMVVGRFFNLVRDSATMHQYNVHEFVKTAKKNARSRHLGESALPSPERSITPEKGFDL